MLEDISDAPFGKLSVFDAPQEVLISTHKSLERLLTYDPSGLYHC